MKLLRSFEHGTQKLALVVATLRDYVPRYYRDHLEQNENLLRKVEEGFMCQEPRDFLDALRSCASRQADP